MRWSPQPSPARPGGAARVEAPVTAGSASAARIAATPGISASRECARRWNGKPRLRQGLADRGRLGRGPVEHGEVGERQLVLGPVPPVDRAAVERVERGAAEQLLDLRRDGLGLLPLVGHRVQHDRRRRGCRSWRGSARARAPACPGGSAASRRARSSARNGSCARAAPWSRARADQSAEVLGEPQEVADVAAAEPVDRLVGVADRADPRAGAPRASSAAAAASGTAARPRPGTRRRTRPSTAPGTPRRATGPRRAASTGQRDQVIEVDHAALAQRRVVAGGEAVEFRVCEAAVDARRPRHRPGPKSARGGGDTPPFCFRDAGTERGGTAARGQRPQHLQPGLLVGDLRGRRRGRGACTARAGSAGRGRGRWRR